MESIGKFVIDLERSREKLRSFQLDHPGLYILKLIQAAVAAGAQEIEVSVRAELVRLRFGAPPEAFPEPLRVAESLAQGQSIENSPLRLLVVGLSASLYSTFYEVQWNVCGPEGGRGLSILPDQVKLTELAPSDFTGFEFSLRRPDDASSLHSRSGEHHLIYDRCRYAPVPIKLDGRYLEKGFPLPGEFGEPSSEAGYWLLQAFIEPEPPEIPFTVEGPRGSLMRRGTDFYYHRENWQQVFSYMLGRPQFGPQKCGAVVGIHSRRNVSRVLPLQYGVTLNPVELNIAGGVLAVFSAERWKTDLTEFQVIRDPALDQRLERLRKVTREAIKKLKGVIGEFRPPSAKKKSGLWFFGPSVPNVSQAQKRLYEDLCRL